MMYKYCHMIKGLKNLGRSCSSCFDPIVVLHSEKQEFGKSDFFSYKDTDMDTAANKLRKWKHPQRLPLCISIVPGKQNLMINTREYSTKITVEVVKRRNT